MARALGNSRYDVDDTLLATVAATAASAVPGVVRLYDSWQGRIIRTIRRVDSVGGVRMRQTLDSLEFDIHIVIEPDTDMLNVARRVERNVTDAVRRVNNGTSVRVKVRIQDISDG